MWRMDEGAISDKSSLPIMEFRFGVTSDIPMAMAFHRIGKLKCWGTISDPPVLESCTALKEAGITDSGRYIIDPDGVDKGVPQFEVFCDMSSISGITVIGHNSERRMPVSPCEEAGCYKRELIYSADISQLSALTTVSQSCEQFVRLDCRHLRFIQSGWGWWVSWDGKRMDYWGGADPSIGGCACGTTAPMGSSSSMAFFSGNPKGSHSSNPLVHQSSECGPVSARATDHSQSGRLMSPRKDMLLCITDK
ncbi:contactin-associated protein-like 2 [Dendrobates tinctorius]|uniref:contactin-associated protein-like 2 n=1 Tax=Dendrobates tinctorius TaxID=92724 RepID=UPI003CC93106